MISLYSHDDIYSIVRQDEKECRSCKIAPMPSVHRMRQFDRALRDVSPFPMIQLEQLHLMISRVCDKLLLRHVLHLVHGRRSIAICPFLRILCHLTLAVLSVYDS